ncbi:MAG: hypothetical protein AAB288_00855, partial [Acidobacteriota bacterium]
WVLSEDGIYQAVYRPAEKGEYSVLISADVAEARLEGLASFMTIESSLEYLHPGMDAAALERIATIGSGTVDLDGKPIKAIEAILAKVQKKQSVMEVVDEHELRDAPILLMVIALAWFAEWALRKRSGLA